MVINMIRFDSHFCQVKSQRLSLISLQMHQLHTATTDWDVAMTYLTAQVWGIKGYLLHLNKQLTIQK